MSLLNKNLPNTFIIGAAKSGTTTIYDLLKQHPQVFLTYDKEPMFFSRDDYFEKGINWYTKTFFSGSQDFLIRAEATPHYLYWAEKVAPRIKKEINNDQLKFIVILRNPIDRAYSWYWNMVSDGREDLPFYQALQLESSRLQKYWNELRSFGSMQYGYYRGGCYSTQLNYYFNFFDRKQFHILFLENLIENQDKEVRKILSFLKIDSNIHLKLNFSNPSMQPKSQKLQQMVKKSSFIKSFLKPFFSNSFRYQLKTYLLRNNMKVFNYPKMADDVRLILCEKYQQEICQLSEMLQKDLSHWNRYP